MADKKELTKAGGATASAVLALAGYGILRLFGGGKKSSGHEEKRDEEMSGLG